jgi:nucleoside-diphosphate-sugar epimerase
MRILVAGATGAIGRSLVALLAAAGHSVVGLTRSPHKAALIRDIGAEPVVADGLDGPAIHAALAEARPDVVVHEMTDLKGGSDLRHFDRAFAASNRLRIEGTDNLLSAARAIGVGRFIAQSFCGWPYARIGGPVKSEDDPLDADPPQQLRATLDAIRYLEAAVTDSTRRPEGIVLRYGGFYGPDTGALDSATVDQIGRRRMPVIGGGTGWWSFVHVADAAAATAIAIERGAPGRIYNIVDDDPAPVAEWLPVLASILGARPPLHIPAWLARIVAGEHGSNACARSELGWRPEHSSWRQGFIEAFGQSRKLSSAA